MGTRGFYDFPHRQRMSRGRTKKDIANTVKALGTLTKAEKQSAYRLLTEHLSIIMVEWASKVLYEAVKRCPYRHGYLRESGGFQLLIGANERIAGGFGEKGAKTVEPIVPSGKGYDGSFSIRVDTWVVKSASRIIQGEFFFDRQEKGVDIALYAHENLEPYDKRGEKGTKKADRAGRGTHYATKPGTGPKYLEGPLNENKNEIEGAIRRAVRKALKVWRIKHKPEKLKKGKK
jgi:hypothetical protein